LTSETKNCGDVAAAAAAAVVATDDATFDDDDDDEHINLNESLLLLLPQLIFLYSTSTSGTAAVASFDANRRERSTITSQSPWGEGTGPYRPRTTKPCGF